MRAVKKINNNVAICIDSKERELIAFGKGIGFPKMPYEIEDLSKIDRTFYNLDEHVVALVEEIPEELIYVTMEIIDKAREYLNANFSDIFIFTLADHLYFSINRIERGLIIENPFVYDLRHLYEKEVELAKWSRRLVNRKLFVNLPIEEEANIAMHFINARNTFNLQESKSDTMRIIDDVTLMIEKHFHILIDREDFNYARFTSHIQYLIKRNEGLYVNSNNLKMFNQLKQDYSDVYNCALSVSEYLNASLNWNMTDDEIMYLMIHINRLQNRSGL